MYCECSVYNPHLFKEPVRDFGGVMMQTIRLIFVLLSIGSGCTLSALNPAVNEAPCVGLDCPLECSDDSCGDLENLATCEPEPVSCDAITDNPDWELCDQTHPHPCHLVPSSQSPSPFPVSSPYVQLVLHLPHTFPKMSCQMMLPPLWAGVQA